MHGLALNKRKVLDAARKFAQKGAKEKALKEYARLLKEDSRDAKLLLEIGDAHRRWGQNEEAINHYSRVAEQYKSGGFDARAVAVFKQILNLDGKRYPAYVALADLYQRMGLDAEAVNALQTAADGYHKEGEKHEALELLRKMATLDPSNTNSRMKVAELLRQEELLADATAEYEAVAEELIRQGASDELIPVYERILEISPDRDDVEFTLARNLIQLSQTERAEAFARRAFDHKKDGEGYFDLLCGVYTDLGKAEALADVTRTMAKMYRDRGDEDEARELMQRLPSEDALEVSSSGASASPAAVGATEDDNLIEDDDFLGGDFLATDDDEDVDLDLDDGVIDNGESFPAEDAGAEAYATDDDADGSSGELPEGDPDQLFAEASVYLRYGKRDQAIASLQAILVQEPQHREALEKIGECYADSGESGKAVSYWLDAAGVAQAAGESSVVDVLRERIAVLDSEAAAGLGTSSASSADESASSLDVDADVDEEVDTRGSNEALEALDSSELEIDLDLDDADSEADRESVSGEAEVAAEDVGEEFEFDLSASEDSEASVDLSLGDSARALEERVTDQAENTVVEQSSDVDGSSAGGDSSIALSQSEVHSQQVREDLEEAEFYMAQELFDEAEAIYKRVLDVAPQHPSAMLRMGELRAARGEDPSEQSAAANRTSDVTLDPADLPFASSSDDTAEKSEDVAFQSDAKVDDVDAVETGIDVDVEVNVDVSGEEEIEIEVEFDMDDYADDVFTVEAASEVEIDVELDDEFEVDSALEASTDADEVNGATEHDYNDDTLHGGLELAAQPATGAVGVEIDVASSVGGDAEDAEEDADQGDDQNVSSLFGESDPVDPNDLSDGS
ncbi:MAG: tetratricopeptide (TPR) repeat protein, partial [Myxococcota bacterium]